MNVVKMPGFTADFSLGSARQQYRETGASGAQTGAQVAPQFAGLTHCFWVCYPGTGCQHVCRFYPF
jgi:hypothetical protein